MVSLLPARNTTDHRVVTKAPLRWDSADETTDVFFPVLLRGSHRGSMKAVGVLHNCLLTRGREIQVAQTKQLQPA